MKPKEPRENGTTGGTGPLNIDAACNIKEEIYIHIQTAEHN